MCGSIFELIMDEETLDAFSEINLDIMSSQLVYNIYDRNLEFLGDIEEIDFLLDLEQLGCPGSAWGGTKRINRLPSLIVNETVADTPCPTDTNAFAPESDFDIQLEDRVNNWLNNIPLIRLCGNLWINKCFPGTSIVGDPPGTFNFLDELDVIEYQARMITRIVVENYSNEFERVTGWAY